ncbi:Phosphatidylglycerol/phosphatidylinositol transfer protein [Elasticomyces elasticus]|nr:Phosphatidylglycerol/phosphatidylinositol transfer protein [Elasticomyces elasticus]
MLLEASFDVAPPFTLFPITVWRTTPSSVIPGGTGLKHCDDPLDPATDLFKSNRLMISPNPPMIGRNVSIIAFGPFEADVSTNATTFWFVDADNAQLVGYGSEDFCDLTTVIQTVNGTTGASCPPTTGSAFLRTDVSIGEYWPPGDWHVHIDARNGTTGDAARLFCIEGNINVRRTPSKYAVLRRVREAILPKSVWIWQEVW